MESHQQPGLRWIVSSILFRSNIIHSFEVFIVPPSTVALNGEANLLCMCVQHEVKRNRALGLPATSGMPLGVVIFHVRVFVRFSGQSTPRLGPLSPATGAGGHALERHLGQNDAVDEGKHASREQPSRRGKST